MTSRRDAEFILKINTVFLSGALLLFCSATSSAKEKPNRLFKTIIDQAKRSAQEPFQDPLERELPPPIETLGYDQWRDIRYKPEAALWENGETPFQIQFFHMGSLFKWPVKINIVDGKGVHAVPFSPQLFNYGNSGLNTANLQGLSFAGFRVHYPINRPDYRDEALAFLGASYFRGLAKDLVYGISARGLAVNTGLPSGEEFPYFKEFWIRRPDKNKDTIVLYGLLDSPSVTGAYRFTLEPGPETNMSVHCVLFARHDIDKLCLAPLTSMYYFGENQWPTDRKDFRPEVHDSDGLLIQTESGEWIWHPLINPKRLLINTFNSDNPLGFALLQRDTNFDHYQDLETRPDLRPSVWVAPLGHWGEGHVELLQIPTSNEYNDNINAFWVPAEPLKAGEKAEYEYTLRWFKASPQWPLTGHVTDTRMVQEKDNDEFLFLLEFNGGELPSLPEDVGLTAQINVTGGYNLLNYQLIKNKPTQGWRLVFRLCRGQRDPLRDIIPSQRPVVDLRVFLMKGTAAVSETWAYSFLP